VALSRSSKLQLAITVLAVGVIVYLAHGVWLPLFGSFLIHDDGPSKADIAVVLAGDVWGNRVLRAAELVKDGYVPAVLVSGPPGFYGYNEADAAIQFAVSKGCPPAWFIPLHHEAFSTRDEAIVVLNELRRRNIRNFLLVTSDYHTGRARRIYLSLERANGGGPELRTVAAADKFFHPATWWYSREGEKIVLLEWMKTVATATGH
jgi:uncharacterized SAM-binding protein YcdF (DUF218 family)